MERCAFLKLPNRYAARINSLISSPSVSLRNSSNWRTRVRKNVSKGRTLTVDYLRPRTRCSLLVILSSRNSVGVVEKIKTDNARSTSPRRNAVPLRLPPPRRGHSRAQVILHDRPPPAIVCPPPARAQTRRADRKSVQINSACKSGD